MIRRYWCASALGLVLLFAATGCSYVREFNQKRYDRHNDRGEAWLSDQTEPAAINISGSWKSDDWGNGFFYQNGSTVTGQVGTYSIKGVVSGQKVYLLFIDGNWTYYSAVLETPNPFMLEGRYTRAIPYERAGAGAIRLYRLGSPSQ